MDKAYTADEQLIEAKDAIQGRKYYCPCCRGLLHFYPGHERISHFRHAKGGPDYQKDACELYSKNLIIDNMYSQEIAAKQRVRLIIEKESNMYRFKVKFPLIRHGFLNMQIHNKYFSYSCKEIDELDFNVVHLLPSRANCEVEVPVLGRYTFSCTNRKYEEVLGLQISGVYEPFSEGPLIFKEIQGQFISIPYRKLTLSGRFFIVSHEPKTIHSDLQKLNYAQIQQFFIYELIMPLEYSEELQNWFTRVLRYTLVAATCHIDLLKPTTFKKIGTTFELSESLSEWQITNIGEIPFEQRVIIVAPDLKRTVLKVGRNKKITIQLLQEGDYLVYMDQEVTDFLTLRYVPEIAHTNNFQGSLFFNNEEILFLKKNVTVTEPFSLQCAFPFYITSDKEIGYEIKTSGTLTFDTPLQLNIPTLWGVQVTEPVVKKVLWSLKSILNCYERHLMYQKQVCNWGDLHILQNAVITSDFIYKDRLLYYIRHLGFQMPKPVYDYIQEMK